MQLNELKWTELVRGIDTAFFTRPGYPDRLDDGVVYRLNRVGGYIICDRRFSPRREWRGLDELTAECILIELTRSE